MQVCVLGATGFIGGHIARVALSRGWRVRALRRTTHAVGHLGDASVEWVTAHLDDPQALAGTIGGAELLFHAAAYYPASGERRPVSEQVAYARRQIDSVLAAARQAGVRRLVYTSSLTTIGKPPPTATRLADESDVYQPGTLRHNAYYEAKAVMERAVLSAAGEDLDAVVLNPTAVFGPGDVHLTMARLLLAAARGWLVAVPPGITNVVDVRDVAQGHIQAALHGRRGQRYILGGQNLSLRQALTLAARLAGKPGPRFTIPPALLDTLVRVDDALPWWNLTGNHLRAYRHWQAYNCSRAQRELGFNARPFLETVRDALHWLVETGHLHQR